MHEVMIGKRRLEGGGLTGVGTYGLYTNAQDVSLRRKKLRTFFRPAWSVRAVFLQVDVLLGVGAFGPAGAEENPGAGGDGAVCFFPFEDVIHGQEIVGVLPHLPRDIDHASRTDELLGRNAVDGVVGQIFPADPVDGGVEMRSGVFAGLECVPIPGGAALVVAG